jgi:hypothetical protein
MERRERPGALGALLFGGLLILVGGYHFLRNNLGIELGPLDGELIWPAVVIVIGVLIVVRSIRPAEAR